EEVVEVGAAGGHLQPVDAAKTAVVEHDDGELSAHHDTRRNLRVQHHVAAVPEHDDDVGVGPGDLDAEPAGDLVAHGRIAVVEVVAAGEGRRPVLVEFARQASRGADEDGVGPRAAHRADDFHVRGELDIGRIGV